jgi:hypothetical protein
MLYPLSHDQKQAVRIMWAELGYDVGRIVDSFIEEKYPVTEMQVIKVIRDDEQMIDNKAWRKL